MSETFNGNLKIQLQGSLSGSPNAGISNYSLSYGKNYAISQGTGQDQANIIWSDVRILTSSASESLNLNSGLTDALGNAIVFTSIKAMIIASHPANVNNVLVGGAASDAFVNWVSDATDVVQIRPGGIFAIYANDPTGYGVTASTADLLKIANSSSGTITYDITLVGTM